MNKIKELRIQNNISQKQMSIELGIAQPIICQWEKGTKNMSLSRAMLVAEYFGVSVDYLMGISDDPTQKENAPTDFGAYDNIVPIDFSKSVPLLGSIACGDPILADENVEQYIQMDSSLQADFALRCKGDSMINARIFDGDIVYIRMQPDVENGEIAAVLIGDEATLKRIYKYPNRIELRAENPTFPPLNFEGKDLNKIKIIGKAVAFLSVVR